MKQTDRRIPFLATFGTRSLTVAGYPEIMDFSRLALQMGGLLSHSEREPWFEMIQLTIKGDIFLKVPQFPIVKFNL